MPSTRSDDIRSAMFGWAGRIATRSPRTVLSASALLAVISAAFAWNGLSLDANTDSLIGSDRPFMQGYRAFLKEFGDLEYLYVAVDAHGDDELARQAVDSLGSKLREVADLPGVHWQVTTDDQLRIATRAMKTEDLSGLADSAAACALVHSTALADRPRVECLLEAATSRFDSLLTSGTSIDSREQRRLASEALLLTSIATGVSDASPSDMETSWGLEELRPEYLRSGSGRIWFIEILPRKDFSSLEVIERPLQNIRGAMAEAAATHGVEIGLTGKPVLQADELRTSSVDMTRGSVLATAIIAVIFMAALRGVREPLLAVAAFAAAFAWTYGAALLLVGRLTLLSTVFMLVLVGAGLDYGVHIIARFAELRRHLPWADAIREAVARSGPPTWTGAATSAVVFLLALLTDFGGLRELGLIAGSGLLLCALSMTLTLPALLALFPPRRGAQQFQHDPIGDAEELERARLRLHPAPPVPVQRRHSRLLLWCAGVSALAATLVAATSLRFEQNLLRLQADGLDSVAWEKRIFADSASASWFAAVVCADEAAARAAIYRAKQERLIGGVRSVLDICQPSTPERDALRKQFRDAVLAAQLGGTAAEAPPRIDDAAARSALLAAAEGTQASLQRLTLAAAIAGRADQMAPLRSALGELADFIHALETDPAKAVAAAHSRCKETGRAFGIMAEGDSAPLREALPPAVAAEMVSPGGKLLVALHPREDVWEMGPMGQFVAAARRVDSAATGVPITQYESLIDMRSAFTTMSVASLLLVTAIVWLDFGSIWAALACIAVLLLGLLWTLGSMALLGVSLNLANFFGIPMLIGLGVDSAVHVLHRARETGSAHHLGWTRRAVLLTAATTAIGFGTLVFAQHAGLRSLGWIIAIGSMAILASTIWVMPPLLDCFPSLLRERPQSRAKT